VTKRLIWVALSLIAPFLALAATPALAQLATATANSPDGSLALAGTTDGDARAVCSLSRRGRLLIAPSGLGFLLTDGLNMVRGWTLAGTETREADQTWEQLGANAASCVTGTRNSWSTSANPLCRAAA